MTEQTRRRVFRFGVAIDLVIIATGVGMLVPLSPAVLIALFVAAVCLTAWKCGWQAGLAALLLSVVAYAGAFPDISTALRLTALAAIGAAAGAIAWVLSTRTGAATSPAGPRLRVVQPEEIAAAELRREAKERDRRERGEAKRAAAEKRAREKAERQREANEKKTRERIEREREMEKRELAEKQAAQEKRRIEEEKAWLRAEEKRRAEAEKHRIEEEKRRADAEKAEARRHAEEERARAQREREAAHAQAESDVAARIAAERQSVRAELEEEFEIQRRSLEFEFERQLETRVEEERRRLEETRAAGAAALLDARAGSDESPVVDVEALLLEERSRAARELEEQIAQARRTAEEEVLRAASAELEQRLTDQRKEFDQRIVDERAELAEEAERWVAEARRRAEEESAKAFAERLEHRLAEERVALLRAEQERAAEAARVAEDQTRHLTAELESGFAAERETLARVTAERIAEARRAAEEEAERRATQRLETALAQQREALAREAEERIAEARRAAEEEAERRAAERLETALAQQREALAREAEERRADALRIAQDESAGRAAEELAAALAEQSEALSQEADERVAEAVRAAQDEATRRASEELAAALAEQSEALAEEADERVAEAVRVAQEEIERAMSARLEAALAEQRTLLAREAESRVADAVRVVRDDAERIGLQQVMAALAEQSEALTFKADELIEETLRSAVQDTHRRAADQLEAALAAQREELAREADQRIAEAARIAEEQTLQRAAEQHEAVLAAHREELAREADERIAEAVRIAEEQAEERAAEQLEAALAAQREELARGLDEEREAGARTLEERLSSALREAHEAALQAAREEFEAKLEQQREAISRDAETRIAEAQRAAEEDAGRRLAEQLEQRLAEERAFIAREADERIAKALSEAGDEASRRASAEYEEQLAAERAAIAQQYEEQSAAERRAIEEDLQRRIAEHEVERRRLEEALIAAQAATPAVPPAQTPTTALASGSPGAAAPPTSLTPTPSTPAPSVPAQPVVARPPETHKPSPPQISKAPAPAAKSNLFDTVSGWFQRGNTQRSVNLSSKRVATNAAPARPSSADKRTRATSRHPRLLMLERRRGIADTAVPKVRQKGVDIEVVERWVDAVDELFRFRPDAIFLDCDHPEFDKIHRTISDKSQNLPIILTGRSGVHVPDNFRHAAFVAKPYDVEELVRIATTAMSRPEELLAVQAVSLVQRTPSGASKAIPLSAPPPALSSHGGSRPPAPHAPTVHARPSSSASEASEEPAASPAAPGELQHYEVECFSCRAPFDAIDADWCSCLTKERTLVCTNCLSCFCKAPPAFKEKFWLKAPPRLFERKTSEAHRQGSLPANPPVSQVVRPLVLTVEDDEDIQAIVHRVCANLGYGFVWANNGQDGLEIARQYEPNLVLSDAFMPKLDGREMCRILKEDSAFEFKAVVMTGLYTDTKYRSEAVKRFHVDDYISKPVSITDLINLLQKHLEGVTGLPAQEDLHELHRLEIKTHEEESAPGDIPLAEVLAEGKPGVIQAAAAAQMATRPDSYPVSCFNCHQIFDAAHSDWCHCVGRDNTLLCEHCGGCFCKAPAAYKERFWIDAPPSLFERKMIGSKRNVGAKSNPVPAEVKRPLILLVEDDENVQLIVRTVVTTMGYGFVVGANGQEGLSLAREYNPDLILSDAFMPKLDGREMCRLLKEDPTTSASKAIIMTGLYTDRKYRNEALDYFKVDDYVAKPLAVDDLIKLFKKHLPQEVQTTH